MLYGEEKYKEQFIESKSRINDLIKTGKDLATIQETKDRLDTIQNTNDQIQQTALPIMDLVTTDRQQALDRGLQEIVPHMSSISNDSDSFLKWLQEIKIRRKNKSKKMQGRA